MTNTKLPTISLDMSDVATQVSTYRPVPCGLLVRALLVVRVGLSRQYRWLPRQRPVFLVSPWMQRFEGKAIDVVRGTGPRQCRLHG